MRSKDPKLMDQMKKYVEEYAMTHNGDLPTIQEIGEAVAIDKSAVSRYMKEMNELGMIRYDRGLKGIMRKQGIEASSRILDLLGSIPCGTPEEREASVEASIAVPDYMLKGYKGDFFVLRATGDSMVDAGIAEGDLVVIHQQEEARDGDLVAALVDECESTLKRYRIDPKGRPYLWAENRTWEDERRMIQCNSLKIYGIAITAVKNLILLTDDPKKAMQ